MPTPLDPEGVPNLDALRDAELLGFYCKHMDGEDWDRLFQADPADAAECELARETARQLGLYAWHLYRARQCREEGRIPGALGQEAQADAIYDQLPDWARW